MCDYSLAGIPSRLAVEGEQLVAHRFSTGSLGLASPCPSQSRWCRQTNARRLHTTWGPVTVTRYP